MGRHFSQQQVEEMRSSLAAMSARDTDFNAVSDLAESDAVAVVHSGKNARVTISTLRDIIVGYSGRGIVSIDKTSTSGNVDTYTITYTSGPTSTFTVTNGLDGTDGTDGIGIVSIEKTSSAGKIDTYTITYTEGSPTTFTVTNGNDGANGADGNDIDYDWDGTKLAVFPSGTTPSASDYVDLKGDTGQTGQTGATGATPNISVGTVTTGNPGTSASVSLDPSSTPAAPKFNFTIPRGAVGETGPQGAGLIVRGSVSTVGDLTQYEATAQVGDAYLCQADNKIYIWSGSNWFPMSTTGYQVPQGGIPSTDMASAVQASLALADSSVQTAIFGTASTDSIPITLGDTTASVLTGHQDISGKANKSEMSVVAGTGDNADKTTITLKTGTSATVLTSHQSLSGYSTTSHTHGNITSSGALQTTDVTIASGDKLVVTDSSNSGKIARASASFDGSTTNKALTPKGTFETFLQTHQDISGKADKVSSATNGNFAALDSNGNLTDSGHKHSDYLTQHQDISGKADKATTLAGYGITDANISNGVITLGSNTITPITSLPGVFSTSANGLVPAASTSGDTDKFLKGDGTWATPSGGSSSAPHPVTITGPTSYMNITVSPQYKVNFCTDDMIHTYSGGSTRKVSGATINIDSWTGDETTLVLIDYGTSTGDSTYEILPSYNSGMTTVYVNGSKISSPATVTVGADKSVTIKITRLSGTRECYLFDYAI